ncbi:coiled-coil alpha-helical rod protein 1, partial [Aplochiton taeniatus]
SSWVTPGTSTSVESFHLTVNPWLAIGKAKQEIVELRKENQRILMLHGDRFKGQNPDDSPSDSRTRSSEREELPSRREAEWRLDKEQLKVEAERLRGQVEALKEAAARHREETWDKDSALNRQSHEMGLLRDKLCKAKTELNQVFTELTQNKEAKEKLGSQLERLERESEGEVERLRREAEKSRQEAQSLALEAEAARLKAGQEADQHTHRLRQQMADSQQKQADELQRLTASFDSELATIRHSNVELQERLCHAAQDVTKLKNSLLEVSTERDTLREQLSQMGEDFDTQSAALQSLRTYIGQISTERGEEERLTETIQRLTKEKETLQVTAELLTVRLNSLNDLLSLQEEEMVKKASSNPLLVGGPKSTLVLQCWREKVYTLLVQLRSKDFEVRAEKDKLHAKVCCHPFLYNISSLEHHVKHEAHLASVVNHSLQDKAAEVELEKLARERVELELTRALKENSQRKALQVEAVEALNIMTQTVERFSLAFEAKMAELDCAQTRLNGLSQRLTFAKRRVDTIQGLTMRKDALRRVQQATKSTDLASERELQAELQAELAVAEDERDKLTQELKRTPELIESALADLRGKFEGELRPLQQEVEQRRLELLEVSAGRAEAEQRLLEAGSQLEDSRLHLEQLGSQLLSQREESDRVLLEKVSEVENRCAQQLRDMEAQLNTARREHTKAVVALRQFERHAERERAQEKETQCLLSQQTEQEIRDLQRLLQEKDKDRNVLLATIRERGMMSEYKKARTAALQSSACIEEHRRRAPEKTTLPGAQAKQQTNDCLMSVLEDLQALSAAVIHSSEEEDKEQEEERPPGRHGDTP